MKNLLKYIIPAALVVSAFSCEKDNYAEPSITLSGHVVYKGEALNLEKDQVPYQIYQYGFGKVGPISSTFAQDGSYSQVLFSGTYKIIIPNGQGPFMWKQTAAGNPDTITVNLQGNQTLDLEVTPYWMISNATIASAGSNVNATFKATQIVTDANAKSIERVSLYINKTQFVAGGTNIAHTDLDGASITDINNISLSVAIPTITPTQNYVFARVGIKLVGVEDMIFSPLVQVSF